MNFRYGTFALAYVLIVAALLLPVNFRYGTFALAYLPTVAALLLPVNFRYGTFGLAYLPTVAALLLPVNFRYGKPQLNYTVLVFLRSKGSFFWKPETMQQRVCHSEVTIKKQKLSKPVIGLSF